LQINFPNKGSAQSDLQIHFKLWENKDFLTKQNDQAVPSCTKIADKIDREVFCIPAHYLLSITSFTALWHEVGSVKLQGV
jgi:hypothetical protein